MIQAYFVALQRYGEWTSFGTLKIPNLPLGLR